MILSVHYDLKKPNRDYSGLYEAIKSCGAWWHHLGSTWLLDTALSSAAVWNRLQPHIDNDDNILIIGVTGDYQGWLSKDAWEWLNTRRNKLAA